MPAKLLTALCTLRENFFNNLNKELQSMNTEYNKQIQIPRKDHSNQLDPIYAHYYDKPTEISYSEHSPDHQKCPPPNNLTAR